MANTNGKPATNFGAQLREVMKDLASKRDTFMVGMRNGDLSAARNANSADNDYKNLERIAKRYETGSYR